MALPLGELVGKAETERVNVEDLGGRNHSKNAASPSQSPAVTALPKGEPRSPFRYVFPLRLLFLQCGTPYRASSTAYGGPPSPKGKVLRDSIQPHRVYSERGGRQIAAPTDTLVGDTIQSHVMYSGRHNCQLSTVNCQSGPPAKPVACTGPIRA